MDELTIPSFLETLRGICAVELASESRPKARGVLGASPIGILIHQEFGKDDHRPVFYPWNAVTSVHVPPIETEHQEFTYEPGPVCESYKSTENF